MGESYYNLLIQINDIDSRKYLTDEVKNTSYPKSLLSIPEIAGLFCISTMMEPLTLD